MIDVVELGVAAAQRALGRRDYSSRELTQAYLGPIEAIDRNVEYLRQILRSENWRLLRRNPPIFAALPDPMATMRGLMLGYIKKAWSNR